MNEELLQKLFNDLKIQESGQTYDDFKTNISNREYFDNVYLAAQRGYTKGTIPSNEDFSKRLGITQFNATQQELDYEQEKRATQLTPNVPVSAEPAMGLLSAIDQTRFGNAAIKTAKNTAMYTMPASVDAASSAMESNQAKVYVDMLAKLEGVPDDKEVNFPFGGGKPAPGPYGNVSRHYKGTAKELRKQFTEKRDDFYNRSADELLNAVETMNSMPYDPSVVQDYAVANEQGVGGWASYMGYSMGQAIPQMLGAALAPGMGSYMQESGQIHIDAIEKIKRENPDMSYEEIIKARMIDFNKGEAWGAGAAAIDLISLGLIGKIASPAFKKASKILMRKGAKGGGLEVTEEMLKKGTKKLNKFAKGKSVVGAGLKGGGTEGVTESIQEWMAEMGARESSGVDIGAEHDIDRYINAGIAGAMPGAFLGGGGAHVSNNLNALERGKAKTLVGEMESAMGEESALTKVEVTELAARGDALVAEISELGDEVGDQALESMQEVNSTIAETEQQFSDLAASITGDVKAAEDQAAIDLIAANDLISQETKETPLSAADAKLVAKEEAALDPKQKNTLMKGILDFLGGGIFTDKFKEHVDRRESNKKMLESNPEMHARMQKGKLRFNNLGKVTRTLANAEMLGLEASNEIVAKAKELEEIRDKKYREEGKGAMTIAEKRKFAGEVTKLAKSFLSEQNKTKATAAKAEAKALATKAKAEASAKSTKAGKKTSKPTPVVKDPLTAATAKPASLRGKDKVGKRIVKGKAKPVAKKAPAKPAPKPKATKPVAKKKVTKPAVSTPTLAAAEQGLTAAKTELARAKTPAGKRLYKEQVAKFTKKVAEAKKAKPITNEKDTTTTGQKGKKNTGKTATPPKQKGKSQPKTGKKGPLSKGISFTKNEKTGKSTWVASNKKGEKVGEFESHKEARAAVAVSDASTAQLTKTAKNEGNPLSKPAKKELARRKRENRTTKEKAVDKIAEGAAMIARSTGTIKNIVQEDGDSIEQGIRILAEGFMDAGAATVAQLVQKLKAYIKQTKMKVPKGLVEQIAGQVIPAKTLADEVTNKAFPTGKDKKGAKSKTVKQSTVDKTASYFIDNFSSIPTKEYVMEQINKLNETLPEGGQITDAMASGIWNRVRKQVGETRFNKLKGIVEKNTTKRNAKGIKVGAWVDNETAKTMRTISEALNSAGRVDEHYDKYNELEEKERNQGLSPEETIAKLVHSLGAFKKFTPESQKIIFDNIKELVETGRAAFLEAKMKVAALNQKVNELVLNTLEGVDHLADGKQFKVKNVYANYSKGDKVIHKDRGGQLVEMTLLEDMPGSDLKLDNENITVKTIKGVGSKRQKGGLFGFTNKDKGKAGIYKWLSADSIFGVEEIVDHMASHSGKVNRQYNSALVNSLTRGLREAGPSETMSRFKSNKIIEAGRKEILGNGKTTLAAKRFRQLQEVAMTEKQLKAFNERTNGFFEGDMDTMGEVLKRWMELHATDIRRVYNSTDNGVSAETMYAELGKILPQWAKDWGKWQLAYYEQLYERVNEVYKRVYGTDLDRINGYSPTVALDSKGEAMTDIQDYTSDMLSAHNVDGAQSKSQTVSNFKSRTGSIPKSVDADKMLTSFVNKMEHFIAFAEPLAAFNSVLSNNTTRAIISKEIGGKYVEYLDQHMMTIANGRMNSGGKQMNKIAEIVRGNVVTAALAINFTLLPKQLVSFPAYLANISWKPQELAKYAGYAAEGMANPKAVLDLFMKEEWMQARWKGGYERDINSTAVAAEIRSMASVGMFKNVKNIWTDIAKLKNYLVSKGMIPTKVGDVAAIMMGGYPMYRMILKENQKTMPKAEAHKEAMFQVQKSSELSQQSPFQMDLGLLQKGSTLERMFTMYMTSPFQYRRQVILSTRNMFQAIEKHGIKSPQAQSKIKEAAKRIAIYHVILPMAFSLASAGFYPPENDEGEIDWAYITGGAILGSFIGIPIIGSLLKSIYERMAGGKQYRISATPIQPMAEEVINATMKVLTEPWDEDLATDVFKAAGMAAGVPVKPFERLTDNIGKLRTDYGSLNYDNYQKALLLLGYSEYAVPQLKMQRYSGKYIDLKRRKKIRQ